MGEMEQEFYIGIDFNDSWTQISYFRPGMEEPETVSTVVGQEKYRIPTVAKEGKSQREMLPVFWRRILHMVPGLTDFSKIAAVTVNLPELNRERVERMSATLQELSIPEERIFVAEDKESFCHFAMNQERELTQHDVALFRCEEDALSCLYLTKQPGTSPWRVEILQMELGILPREPADRDRRFGALARQVFLGKIVSAVYLTGDGLEGGWLKDSLNVLCRGRRVFQGKNLFTKGACYGSYLQMHKEKRGYVYFSEYKVPDNVFLKVHQGDRAFFQELAEAGESVFAVGRQYQVLLEGEPQVDVWLRAPDSSKARIVSLELTDLPKRPPKATRLRIEALSDERGRFLIRITDLGFGAWYESSGKVWEYCINE